MHQIACTLPTSKGAAPAVVAPVASGSGVCIPQGWKSAHDLARHALAHQWPFMSSLHATDAQRVARRGPACGEVPGAAVCVIPDGNHGDNTVEVAK